MKTDAEFDAYLTSQLEEAPLPDRGFTRAVTVRIERHRRRRQLALMVVIAVASVAVAPFFSLEAITPETIVATLLLATICSLVWIGTESGLSTTPTS